MKRRTSWLVLAATVCLLSACSETKSDEQSPDDRDAGGTDGADAGDDDGGDHTSSSGPGSSGGNGGTTANGDADAATNEDKECGDRFLNEQEECDDGNQSSADGCSATCKVEDGYACPIVGARCRAATCGDLKIVGDEECEDGNSDPLDGCDERCRLEDGFACAAPGELCHATRCGDGKAEGREQCDDGSNDVPYDGCYACTKEPNCTSAGCAPVCGDGIKFPGEACDDGNIRSGDGCSSSCAREDGFTCTESVVAPPAFVDLPIILRDFRGKDLGDVPAAGLAAGHPDFEDEVASETGIVKELLSSDKKPVYASASGTTTTTSGDMFDKWYRDDPAYNRTIVDTVRLDRNTQGDYVFIDTDFFPLDDRGFVAEGHESKRGDHNFHFTSEVRTWFTYQGGEQLDFFGDDDVWVFVNGHLAVDLGGVHGELAGSVTLDASGSDARFALQTGNIYEIVVFQAERHTSESKYRLTLRDFVKARTSCETICGDGVLTPDEACDDKVNAGGYGECAEGCVFGPRCGDGLVQAEQGEECDDKNRKETDGCSNTCKNLAIEIE